MVSAPFRERVLFLFAIQTLLCGGSRLPFGSGAIPFRETLQVSRHEFVCLARSVRVSSVRRLVNVLLVDPLLEFSLSVFIFVLRFAVMVLLFGVVCSVSLVLARFEGRLYELGKSFSSQRSSTCAGPRVGSS